MLDAVERARADATVSYDPNARPSLMGQPQDVRAKIEQIVGLSDVVKASDEDVHWLYDGAPVPEVMRLWGRLGPTRRRGDARRRGRRRRRQRRRGEHGGTRSSTVADTVGAGDSFMAGLVSGLLDAGLLGGPDARARLHAAGLDQVRPARRAGPRLRRRDRVARGRQPAAPRRDLTTTATADGPADAGHRAMHARLPHSRAAAR